MSERNRDLMFLTWAALGAPLFSTCSRRNYMAIIVAPNGRVVGTGYNGAPSSMRHCIDGGCPRGLGDVPSGPPYDNCIAVHAEANAIMFSPVESRRGGTLYVTGVPCSDCAKLIASSGVARLVYLEDDRPALDMQYFDFIEVISYTKDDLLA